MTLCISTVGLRGTQHRFCPRSLAFSGATRAQRAGIPGIVYGQCLSRLDGYLDTRSKDSKSAQVCVCFFVASAYFVLDSYTQFPRCRYDHSRGIKVAIGLFGPSLCGTRDGPGVFVILPDLSSLTIKCFALFCNTCDGRTRSKHADVSAEQCPNGYAVGWHV